MDSLWLWLVDKAFFLAGKEFLWLPRATKTPTPEFGHWGSVVLGFTVTAIVVCLTLVVSFGLQWNAVEKPVSLRGTIALHIEGDIALSAASIRFALVEGGVVLRDGVAVDCPDLATAV